MKTPALARVALLLAAGTAPLAAQNRPQFPELKVADAGPCGDMQVLDVDGDGHLDLVWVALVTASATPLPAGLYVARGDGTGALAAPVGQTAGAAPDHMALGDLDGDGKLDAVVSAIAPQDISVLLGDGAGGFGPAAHIAPGQAPTDVELDDLDGDGDLDAVVAFGALHTLLVYEGDGSGQLAAGHFQGTIHAPQDVALLDLDQDGDADVVSAEVNFNFALYENQGEGSLKSPVLLEPGIQHGEILVIDVNEDALADLLVTGSSGVQVCLADGAGGVTEVGTHATDDNMGDQPAVGDVNRDGHVDLLVPQRYFPELVEVFAGDGTGDFESSATLAEVGGPRLALGDFDEDGTLDLVVSQVDFMGPDLLGITRGDPAGLFVLPVAALPAPGQPVGTYVANVALADVDGDDLPDLLTADDNPDGLGMSRNLGDGRFLHGSEWTEPVPIAQVRGLAAFDMDLDGSIDAVIGCIVSRQLRVLLAEAGGGWLLKDTENTGKWPEKVAAGHLNSDALPDVVVANTQDGTLQLHFGQGGGRISAGVLLPLSSFVTDVHVGDATGDGLADIVAGTEAGLVVLPGNGSGSFATTIQVALPGAVTRVDIADLDGDGVPGVLAGFGWSTSRQPTGVRLIEGNGSTGLATPGTTVPVPHDVWDLDAADLGGDGRADLVLAHLGVSVLDQDASGGFPLRRGFGSPGTSHAFAVDANGDGTRDIVIGSTEAMALLNADGPLAVLGEGLSGTPIVPALALLSEFSPGAPLSLRVAQAAPSAPTVLFAGLSLAAAPLKGGVLVPGVDLLVALATDADGKLKLEATWPAGVPEGTQVWLQAWIADGGAPQGFAATRGLQVTAP